MRLREKASTIIGFTFFILLLNIPLAFSLYHSDVPLFFLAGITSIDLPLILLAVWLSLENFEVWGAAALLIGPTLLGISLGLSAVVYEMTLGSCFHWTLIFSCVVLFITAIFYTQIINIYIVEGSDALEDDDYGGCLKFIKLFTISMLVFCFNAIPTYNLAQVLSQHRLGECLPILISYGLILIFQPSYYITTRILRKLKRNDSDVSVKEHWLFNSICFGHLFIYTPIAVYFITAAIQSVSSLDSSQRQSPVSLALLLFNAILLALTIPSQAIFTIYNGIIYLDYHYARCFTGITRAVNPSFFAVSSFQTEEMLISVKIEEYRSDDGGSIKKCLTQTQFKDCKNQSDCWICLESFKVEDVILAVNTCKHIFHEKCIEKWIMMREICPVCRSEIRLEVTGIDTSFAVSVA